VQGGTTTPPDEELELLELALDPAPELELELDVTPDDEPELVPMPDDELLVVASLP
jgi:hypothetical protein